MCKKLSSAIFGIKFARFLPVYISLVESRLRYCCTVWGNCGTTLKTRLQNLEHRAACVISKNSSYSGDPSSFMNEMNLLNVQQLIDYSTALMIWKAKHGVAPEYIFEMFVPIRSFHDYNTRKAEYGFHQTKKNLNFGIRSFSHHGCQLWNSLLKDVQASTCLCDLKKKLKNFVKGKQNVNKISLLKIRENILSHGPSEDQTLSKRALCLKKFNVFI